MVVAAQLIARVSALGADVTQAQLLGLGKASDAAQARFSALGAVAAGALAVGLVAAGAKMAQMAGNFQQGVNRLRTGAGDTQDSFNTLATGILKVSTATGVLTPQLIQAMYEILSSGQRGAQAFSTLTAAAQGAQIEQAKVADVASALSTVMKDYGTSNKTATQYMNGLIAAVANGRITLQNLSTAMGPIMPLAHDLGVSFSDLAAAMATQTNAGIPAYRAATGLRFMLSALENPTKKATTAMAEMGLKSVDVANAMKKSLPTALQLVWDAAKKAGPEGSVPFNRAISDMVGGTRGLQAYLALTGVHMKEFAADTNIIGGAMAYNTKSVNGWSIAQSNFNVVMDKAKAAVEAGAIKIGMVLLPALTKVVSAVTPLITKFADFAAALLSHKEAVAIFAGLLAGLLTPAIIGLGTALFSASVMGAPLILIILGVMAAVAGVILVIMHWGDIMKWAGGIFSWLGTKVHEIVDAIHQKLTDLKNWVGNIFSEIGKAIHDKITDAKNFVGQKFSDLGSAVHDKLTGLKNKVGDLFDKIGSTIHDKIYGAYQDVVKAGQWLYDHNTYVKKAVDFIGAYFHTLGALLHDTIMPWIKNTVGGAFDWLGTHLHDAATKIKNTVGGAFDWLGSHLRDAATNIKNWVGQRFSDMGAFVHDKVTWIKNTVGGLFDQLGTNVRNKVTDLKNAVGSKFSELGTDIQGKVKAVGDWLGGFFGGLVQQAFSWGQNLVQGFINGLGSLMSKVGETAHNIVSTVAGWLGFHSPAKNVPESAMWGPNLMKMFVAGLKAGVPDVHAVLSTLFRPITMQVGANLTGSGTLTGTAPRYLFPLPASGSAPIVVNVQPPPLYIDSYRMAGALMPGVANQLRNRVPGMVGR